MIIIQIIKIETCERFSLMNLQDGNILLLNESELRSNGLE